MHGINGSIELAVEGASRCA